MTKMILPLLLLFSMGMTAQVENDSIKDTKTEELDEVQVQSTRTSRTIRNTPTRIETIDAEELEEKGNMKPANVSMVLHESTGYRCSRLRQPAETRASGYRDWTGVIPNC